MSRNVVTKSEGQKLGYCRVSAKDQNLDSQFDALKAAGCTKIFSEKESGVKKDRPEFQKMLELSREGDIIVVTRLDRASRSLRDLLDLLDWCKTRNVAFQSLTESINTDSASGNLIVHLLSAVAEFQRSLIKESQRAGIDAAKRRGKRLGRRPALSPDQVTFVKSELKSGRRVDDVANLMNVSRMCVYRLKWSDPSFANV